MMFCLFFHAAENQFPPRGNPTSRDSPHPGQPDLSHAAGLLDRRVGGVDALEFLRRRFLELGPEMRDLVGMVLHRHPPIGLPHLVGGAQIDPGWDGAEAGYTPWQRMGPLP